MQTPSFLGVSSQLTLGVAEMTPWGQGTPEETLVISCLLCCSACGAPLDPWTHWRMILIVLMAKEFACSRAGLCLLLVPGRLLGCPGCSAKLGSFQRWDNLTF